MMKIVREYKDETEFYKKHIGVRYHKIKVSFNNNTLYITKNTNYLWGHHQDEIMDEVSTVNYNNVVFKTHNIDKLTDEIEKECVKKLKENFENKIDEKKSEISVLYSYIDSYEDSIKGINKYFRTDKINRINS